MNSIYAYGARAFANLRSMNTCWAFIAAFAMAMQGLLGFPPAVNHAGFLSWWPLWTVLFALLGAVRYSDPTHKRRSLLDTLVSFMGIWLWTMTFLAANFPFTGFNPYSMPYTVPILIEAWIFSQSLRVQSKS